jgi:hypothetical protein
MMLAHYHGQTMNYSELGRSFGASDNTIRRYLDLLSSTFMVRQLSPWHENIRKRQVEAPKIYIRDSGIFHTLLGVDTPDGLQFHPKIGPSWEGGWRPGIFFPTGKALEKEERAVHEYLGLVWARLGGQSTDYLGETPVKQERQRFHGAGNGEKVSRAQIDTDELVDG